MESNRRNTRTPGEIRWRRPVGLGAALLCAAGLWGQFGGAEHGPAIAATVLAGAVLALTLVLAVNVPSRRR